MRAAVLGSPIAHSLSPALHRAAYAALGLTDWRYDAVEVDEAGLAQFLAGLDQHWAGLSLTRPLKRAVVPALDEVSPLARAVGAVNTVLVRDGRLVGDNTDVHGIVSALQDGGIGGGVGGAADLTGHVIGAGATACSALAALRDLGCGRSVGRPVVVHVRDAGRAGGLLAAADRLGTSVELAGLGPEQLAVAAAADLLVCTLPAGAADRLAAGLFAEPPRAVLLDVVYHPWPTPLAAGWAGAGGRLAGGGTPGGLSMLLHQAAEQVRLMTGRAAPLEQMRTAGEQALAGRGTA